MCNRRSADEASKKGLMMPLMHGVRGMLYETKGLDKVSLIFELLNAGADEIRS